MGSVNRLGTAVKTTRNASWGYRSTAAFPRVSGTPATFRRSKTRAEPATKMSLVRARPAPILAPQRFSPVRVMRHHECDFSRVSNAIFRGYLSRQFEGDLAHEQVRTGTNGLERAWARLIIRSSSVRARPPHDSKVIAVHRRSAHPSPEFARMLTPLSCGVPAPNPSVVQPVREGQPQVAGGAELPHHGLHVCSGVEAEDR